MLPRLMLLVAAIATMVALAATPAFAQDDDDGGDDDDDGAGQVAPAPQGGVQTGAGGTADTGPDALALAMAGGSMLLVMTAGGFVLRRREAE